MVGNRVSSSIQEGHLRCWVFGPGGRGSSGVLEWGAVCRSRGVTFVSLVYTTRQK